MAEKILDKQVQKPVKPSIAKLAKEAKQKLDAPMHAAKANNAGQRIAIIRIRGTDDVNTNISDTMIMLKLHKKHTCSIYDKNDVIMGMAAKCKDYCTFGEIDDETYKMLVEKRGIKKEGKLQNYFHLSPPRGGFERHGIKYPFSMKGALGYRAEKINILIRKMI